MRAKTKKRTRLVVITSLIAVVGLSTSAWAIASKAEEPIKREVALSSPKKVTLTAEVAKPTSTKATISKKQLISKEKIDELVIEKANKVKLAKEAEVQAKQAEAQTKQAEVDRIEKIAVDKAEKSEADKVEASKLAQVAANKAKQEEIDRVAAEMADPSKQARTAENYKIEKASFDKAEKIKADKLAKIELDRLAKVETDRIAKVETDRVAKVETDKKAKVKTDKIAKKAEVKITKEDSTTKEKADKIAKIEADRVAKIKADRLNRIEADRLNKIEAVRLAKREAARLAKIEADRIAEEKGSTQTAIQSRIANYLSSSYNVTNVLNTAVALHGGETSNNCVYFSSEAMRRMGVSVPRGTCNTRQYLSYLNARGWEANWNIKKLRPGSICFTTNDGGGYPTHTFVFMGWANSNYTSAYVADNQGSKVHIRDMRATYSTDKFAYFMHN